MVLGLTLPQILPHISRPIPRQSLKIGHVLFFGVFFVFVAIGFPTLFAGCNPDVDHMCMTYGVVHATTYEIRDETDTCRDCVSRNCGRKTCQDCGDPYTCYRAVVLLNYGDSNDNCEYNDRKKKFRSEQARDDYFNNEYPLGSMHNFLVKGRDEENANARVCTKIEKGMGIWIAGMVFICCAGITLISWIVYSVMTYEDWKANTVYAPPPATRLPNNVRYNVPASTHVEMVSAPPYSYRVGESGYPGSAPYSSSPYDPQSTPAGAYGSPSSPYQAYPASTPNTAVSPNSRAVSYNAPAPTQSAYEDYDYY